MSTSADAFSGQRRTVTCVVRTATGGRDSYGNPLYEDLSVEVPGCLVAPTGSNDNHDNADRAVDSATVYDPTGAWPGGTVNRVRLDDATWEVDGDPQRWPGPIGGTVIQLRKVSG